MTGGRRYGIPALLALLLAFGGLAARAQEASVQDEMRAGMIAYQFSNFEEAAKHFEEALRLNPGLVQARLYLASTNAQRYIPGDETPDNVALAQQAIDGFKQVLDADSSEEDHYRAIVSIASLSYNLKHLDDSRNYYGQAIALNPEDPRNYFSLALIDWMEASKLETKTRESLGLNESEMISDPAACASLRTANQQKVEDGIKDLQKALELNPDYSDAMGYLNLLYRARAEYECDDADARKADLKASDEWNDKAMAAKVAEEQQAAADAKKPVRKSKQVQKPKVSEEPVETEKPKQADEPKQPEAPTQADESKSADQPKEPEAPKQADEPKQAEPAQQADQPSQPEAPKQADEPNQPEAPKSADEPNPPAAPKQADEPAETDQSKPAETDQPKPAEPPKD